MKTRILFVNDEMTMGGVARILNNLLKQLDQEKYSIDLLVLNPHGDLMKEIPEGIRVLKSDPFFRAVDVNLTDSLRNYRISDVWRKAILIAYMKSGWIIPKLKTLRKRILDTEYDIEFSAKEGFCTIFVAAGNSQRKLNWVQVDYSQQNYSRNHMRLMIESLKNIDMNIACSIPVAKAYSTMFETDRIKVVHNFIDDRKIRALSDSEPILTMEPEELNLISVARFHPQKGLDRLLEAFAQLRTVVRDARLYLIGDGELKTQLVQLASDLWLQDSIEFLGMQANPYPLIRQADLFVMSSIYEGYPTIVIESMLCSTPVLTTAVSGVDEQITQDEDGWIVENSTEALSAKLLDLCQDRKVLRMAKNRLQSYSYPNAEILKMIEAEFTVGMKSEG